MYTVIETTEFIQWATKVWSDSERVEFINWIAQNPLSGDVVTGTDSLRKVRWTRQGMGKLGGARVIYFNRLESGEVVLLIVYAKAKFDKLSNEFLKKLMEKFNE
jgi:hypothetical protein